MVLGKVLAHEAWSRASNLSAREDAPSQAVSPVNQQGFLKSAYLFCLVEERLLPACHGWRKIIKYSADVCCALIGTLAFVVST